MYRYFVNLLFLSTLKLSYQIMNTQYKTIKRKELNEFLHTHHAKKLLNRIPDYVHYYECDNNILVVDNTKANNIAVYYDREKVYSEELWVQKWKDFNPFKSKQSQILAMPKTKDELMNELFDSLKLSRTSQISGLDLTTMNKAIKIYGYDKVIENLYTNLVVLGGEYVKEKRGGDWRIMKSKNYSSTYEPMFIDKQGNDYSFWLNHNIIKSFNQKRSFDFKQCIEFALINNPFKVEPNNLQVRKH
jgi:hypothetical protein